MLDQMEPAPLWELFCMTGEPLAYMLYRSIEGGGESGSLLGMTLALASGVTYAGYMVAVDKTAIRDLDPFPLELRMKKPWE